MVKYFANAKCEMKSTHPPSRRISLPEGQFHRRRRFHPPARVDFVEKRPCLTTRSFFWWGKVDSNHRRRCQQIYSLSPLATREFPQIMMPCFTARCILPQTARRVNRIYKKNTRENFKCTRCNPFSFAV